MRKGLVVLTIFACSSAALAGLAPVVEGEAVDGNSWAQAWYQDASATSPYDMIVFTMESAGDTFKTPTAVKNISRGWSQIYSSPLKAAIAGPALSSGRIDLKTVFEGSKSDGALTFNWYTFTPGQATATGGWECHWTGSRWVVSDLDGALPDRSIVPVPGAALLGVFGLGLVARMKRRVA